MRFIEIENELDLGTADHDILESVMDGEEVHDSPREKVKTEKEYYKNYVRSSQWAQKLIRTENRGFNMFYTAVAVVSCAALIGVLLFTISYLPRYGVENPESTRVVRRYIESGLQETGAINIVSGIILDYRAFDTLGESHVLFTALMCVTVLLMRDKKNMRTQYEDFYTIRDEKYHELYRESIMRLVAGVLLPCLFLFSRRRLFRRSRAGFRHDDLRGGVRVQDIGQSDHQEGGRSDHILRAGILQLREGICLFYRRERIRESHTKGYAGRHPERRADPAARYRGGSCSGLHDVRLLQSVPKGQYRRKQLRRHSRWKT